MIGNKSPGSNKGPNTIQNSFHGLASVLAVAAALLCAAPIFEYSYEPALAYFADAFESNELGQLGALAFTGLATSAVFFIARITLILAATILSTRVLTLAL